MIRKTLLWSAALSFSFALACDNGSSTSSDSSNTGVTSIGGTSNGATSNGSNGSTGGGGGGTGSSSDVPAPYAGKTNPVEGDSAAISAGNDIYTMYCATCHGESGDGNTPTGMAYDPPSTDFTMKVSPDDYMLWIISEGKSTNVGMIPYKNTLSEDEMWQVISYIRTLQP